MSRYRRAAGPVRWAGRQFTRAGSHLQRWRLLPPAEACFRAAVRLWPDPSWALRLGRLQEARKKWAAAEATYARGLEAGPPGETRRAGIRYRQARARVHRQDWAGAQSALAEAIRLRPDVTAWQVERARAYEHLADWAAAAGCYQEAARLEPDNPRFQVGLIQSNLKALRVPEAVEAGKAALARAPGHARLRRLLAEAYEAYGDWSAAASLFRGLLAERPGDRTLRARLARCLEWLLKAPPELGGSGDVAGPAGAGSAGADELVGHLRRLAEPPDGRPDDWYRLGLFQERTGQLDAAAESYQAAMERLSAVDSWWCHKAAYDWEFRLAYVQARLTPSAPSWSSRSILHPNLSRRVTQVGGPVADGEPAAGFVDALIAREGLRLSGFLLPGRGDLVDFYVDDQLLKRIRADPASWRPTFRFDPSPGVLGDLPERSRLTVRAGDRPLVTTGGGCALEVSVPGGTGTLRRKLASGHAPTKKGSWPPGGRALPERRERYLELYGRAKELLEARGLRLFLAYGTLLGCERSGEFIAGDDDFDASYVSHAVDPAGFRRECRRLALDLLGHGLDVRFAINGRMFQIGLDRVWIDVAPTWFHQGRAWAFRAHDLTLAAIEPVRVGSFVGRSVYLPRDPALLLADTYGPDWRTPQPSFRHYRSAAENRVLSLMWATPSEVREFAQLAVAQRRQRGSVGRFVGIGGTPNYPGYNWLTPEPEEAGEEVL